MTMIYINSLSIIAPGMMGLAQAMPILKGEQSWQGVPMEKIVADLLPANERRRTTSLIKLCLKTAQQAMPVVGAEHAVATVFASSEGDLEITDKICKTLLLDDKPVSPTQFHNSVHNAAAGYWAIAAQFQKPSVSLSAGDASFAAGLLETVSQIMLDEAPVLYVAYDYPAPPLLDATRHFDFPFATAMLLSREKGKGCLASFELAQTHGQQQASVCKNTSLEQVRQGNPIGQSLPLLEAVVAQDDVTILLPYINEQTIKVDICH